MIKKISAILLVFALLAGFAACRRLEGNEFNKQENIYAVDDEGVTQEVSTRINEDGKTEYYYTDKNGNDIVVDKNNITVETTYVPVKTTLSDKEIDKIIKEGDIDKLEDVVTEDITEPEFEMSDDIISEETFEEVKPELDNEGKPVHTPPVATIKSMEEILKGGTFTLDFSIKSNIDGVESTMPVKIMKDGNKMFMETVAPLSQTGKVRVNMIVNDDGYFLVLPVMNAYYKAPTENMEGIGDISNLFGDLDFTNVEDDLKMSDNYESSAKVTINGQVYDCDIYKADDGSTVKYYYLNSQLKRIENISDAGNTIIEFKEISEKVDKSKFKTPKGRDLEKMVEGFESLGSLVTTTKAR